MAEHRPCRVTLSVSLRHDPSFDRNRIAIISDFSNQKFIGSVFQIFASRPPAVAAPCGGPSGSRRPALRACPRRRPRAERRHRQGLVLMQSAADNVTMPIAKRRSRGRHPCRVRRPGRPSAGRRSRRARRPSYRRLYRRDQRQSGNGLVVARPAARGAAPNAPVPQYLFFLSVNFTQHKTCPDCANHEPPMPLRAKSSGSSESFGMDLRSRRTAARRGSTAC